MNTYHNKINNKAFTNQYIVNILDNQINVYCPICGIKTSVFPEHINKAYCHTCLQNNINSKLEVTTNEK